MPLLLILSALLTALTGVVTGVRPLDVQIVRQASVSTAAEVPVAAKTAASAHRHLLGDFGVSAAFASIIAAPAPLIGSRHLYLDRLRV